MIAVRGTIRHKGDRRSPNSSPTPTSNFSSTTAQFNPLKDTQAGEWIWNGYWAFGSLPSTEILENIGQQKRKKPPTGVRPFVYKFQSIKDAKDVIVPSSLIYSDDDDEGGSNNKTVHDSELNKDDSKKEQLESKDLSTDNKDMNKSDKDTQKETAQEQKPTNDDKVEEKNRKRNDGSSMKVGSEVKPSDEKQGKQNSEEGNTSTEEEGQQSSESNDQQKQIQTKPSDPVGESFADVEEGSIFTDGGILYPKRCPIGGCWKGYFENVSTRKDRMSSRVQEVFHLFFNATPPPDARMKFIDNDLEGTDNQKDAKRKDGEGEGELPKGYIHVRGAGTNQFGTFEILGGYNLETGVLACQRIYVSTSETSQTLDVKKEEKDKIKLSPSNKKQVKKSYFTRKRPPGSWRSSSYGAYDDDIYDTGTGRANSGRKRQRAVSEGGAKISMATTAETDFQNNYPQITIPASNTSRLSDSLVATIPTSNQEIKVVEKKQESITPLPVPGNPTPIAIPTKRPSMTKTPSSRKTKSSPSVSSRSSSSINSSAYQIKIPRTGNPHDARWRAAHFIYFQRQTENRDSSSPPNATVGSTTTNFVVYEGEMNLGKNLRDGRGVCLYNNGTIYEGEWKRNKEHGIGTLTTGDRKRIIYTGDWERGKMHGRGTYYYHMYSNIDDEVDSKNGGMYTGDFKENARHGVGTYYLPGGGIYSGDWRENVPCGKGTFKWSDGSSYDGMWKDGSRNGWGELKCSDGFEYEGNWKDNAMEGRGRATYPKGSMTYDGMWLDGKRDGRGTIIFANGAVYKGRFKEDNMEGQGTLKLDRNVAVPRPKKKVEEKQEASQENKEEDKSKNNVDLGDDWMIPIEFQSDIGRIHEKAGFTTVGE